MPFQFIDNNTILDDTKRKLIRSHAALGRNKGKRLSRPSRKSASRATSTRFYTPNIVQQTSQSTGFREIERPINDGLVFPGLLPGETNGVVKNVIAFMSTIRYSSELDDGLDYSGLATPICVQYMFIDEAFFHCAMATSLSCLAKQASKPEDRLWAMRHVSRTFSLVNQKLAGQNAVTDLTIAVIVSMAQYEHHQNQYQQGSVHVQGLHRIAHLRGGIPQLIKNPTGLVQKVLRVDLEYALQLGSPTLFAVEEAILACKPTTLLPSSYLGPDTDMYSALPDLYRFANLSTNLRNLLIDVMFLASLMHHAIAGVAPKMTAIKFHNTILVLGYRLLKIKPLGVSLGAPPSHNGVYLGLTAFLLTFLQGWDGRVPCNALLSKLLLAEARRPQSLARDDQEILLWLLHMGAASSGLWEHPVWVTVTKHTLHELGIQSWESVKGILVRLPWINAVHDAFGQALWSACNKAPSDKSTESV